MQDNLYRRVPKYLEKYFTEDSQFHYYYEMEKNVKLYRDIENKFICLKGFSSSTPIVNSITFENECVGGGFYFRHNGVGIAVDPGIGFVSLMHKNNIFIDDIDVVIVTHNHIDHNCDVNCLSALLHDYNKNKKRELLFYEKFFECNEPEAHGIQWYMDDSTKNNVSGIIDAGNIHSLSDICDSKGQIELNKGIFLSAIRTEHIRNNRDTYCIKLKFCVDDVEYVWGYTSDTKYFSDLSQFMRDADIVLFNISDVYEKDFIGTKGKSGHLGFDGSVRLLKKINSKVAIATEFCCMNGDYRHEIVKGLSSEVKKGEMRIMPAHPGLTMTIDGKHVVCSLCKQIKPIQHTKISKPEREFDNIRYVCEECLI